MTDQKFVKRRFNDIAEMFGFKNIPNYTDPKYTTIKDYPVWVYSSPYQISPVFGETDESLSDESEKVDVTVSYILWQNPIYVKMLYLSFLSQVLYSDVFNVKKFIIYTDLKLEDLVWEVFRPFTQAQEGKSFQIEIRAIHDEHLIYSEGVKNFLTPTRINKHLISTNDRLRSTKLLTISDCESFLYGKPTPVYRQIEDQYNETDNFPVLGCREETPGRSVFLERRKSLAGMMYDDDEYIGWVEKRLGLDRETFENEFVCKDYWYLTCFFIYDSEKYNPNDEDWREYLEWARAYGLLCDESVYLTYGYKKGYDVDDLSYIDNFRFVHAYQCEKFFNQDDPQSLGVLHPLHGQYIEDKRVQKYYDHFQNEFEVKLEQAHEQGVSFRELLPQYSDNA